MKKFKVRTFEKDFIVLKRKFRETLGIIDYTHLWCLFLNKNDRKLKHRQDIHSKRFFDLSFENSQTSHDPGKVIFNYSFHGLTESEKSYFSKGLNFAIPPKTLEYADLLPPFILLYRDTHNLDITNEKTEVLKTRIKDCACSSFNTYNENGAPLIPKEFAALKSLSKNKNSVIQKSDKGNSIAIIDKSDYLEKMRNILSDKQLNFIVNVEKLITDPLKDSKNSEVISETVYKSFKPRGSTFGTLYRLCTF